MASLETALDILIKHLFVEARITPPNAKAPEPLRQGESITQWAERVMSAAVAETP